MAYQRVSLIIHDGYMSATLGISSGYDHNMKDITAWGLIIITQLLVQRKFILALNKMHWRSNIKIRIEIRSLGLAWVKLLLFHSHIRLRSGFGIKIKRLEFCIRIVYWDWGSRLRIVTEVLDRRLRLSAEIWIGD